MVTQGDLIQILNLITVVASVRLGGTGEGLAVILLPRAHDRCCSQNVAATSDSGLKYCLQSTKAPTPTPDAIPRARRWRPLPALTARRDVCSMTVRTNQTN
jgi:hypothetical protein